MATDEQKKAEIARKKSEAMKKHWANRAFQRMQSKGVVDKWKDPAYRKKISEARKAQHAKGEGGRGGGKKKGKK